MIWRSNMKLLLNLIFILTSMNLTACTQNQYAKQYNFHHYTAPKVKNNTAIDPEPMADASGTMLAYNRRYSDDVGRYSMDSSDKSKLSHALDNPLGKSTTWTNENSGITYTVVPTKKVTISGNPFCREYTLTENRSGRTRESYGTACVDTKSSKWQSARSEWESHRSEWPARRSHWPYRRSAWPSSGYNYSDY